MEPLSDLELKTSEKEAQPVSLLGIEPWVIRTLPDHLKVAFLNQYKRAIQVSHHPDLYQDLRQKRVHEKFLQATGSYIELLLENPMEREFAFDALHSKPNPEVRLKERIQTLEKEITGLQGEIQSEARKYESWKEVQKKDIELREYEVFALSNFSDIKVLNSQFSGKVNFYDTRLHSRPLPLLQECLLQTTTDDKEFEKKCSTMVRDHFIAKTKKVRRKEVDARETFEFKNGKANNNKMKIVGGFSYRGLTAYMLQASQSLDPANPIAIIERRSDALKNLWSCKEYRWEYAPGNFTYEAHRRLSPFVRSGMLCIIQEEKPRRSKVEYSLKFIDTIG